MAQIAGSVRVAGFIAPSDSTDTYPVTTEEYNRGGYRSVLDEAERLSITTDRRKIGMLVKQTSDDTYWTLVGGIENVNWELENLINYPINKSNGSNLINLSTDATLYNQGLISLNTSEPGSVGLNVISANNNSMGINIQVTDSGSGMFIYQDAGGTGLNITNTSGVGQVVINPSTGSGIVVQNTGAGTGLNITNTSTGVPLVVRTATTDLFKVDNLGNVDLKSTATYKIGGVSIIPQNNIFKYESNSYRPYANKTEASGGFYDLNSNLDTEIPSNSGDALCISRPVFAGLLAASETVSIIDTIDPVEVDLMNFSPKQISSGTTVSYLMRTKNSLITAGDRLFSFQNVTTPVVEAKVVNYNSTTNWSLNVVSKDFATKYTKLSMIPYYKASDDKNYCDLSVDNVDGITPTELGLRVLMNGGVEANGYNSKSDTTFLTLKNADASETWTALTPATVDGASAVIYKFDTRYNITTEGAKLASFQNNGTELIYFTKNGSIRHQGTYGSIYVADGVTVQSIPTGATYTKVTTIVSNGLSFGMVPDGTNSKITATYAAKYLASLALSYSSGTADTTWIAAIFVNGVEQVQVEFKDRSATANDFFNSKAVGIIQASAGNDVDVRIRHNKAGSVNLTISNANLTLVYLGE